MTVAGMFQNWKGRADSQQSLYGLIAYQGSYYDNIGDEIQSLAALQLLPRVDHLIPIDEIERFRSDSARPVKVILNGYFTCNPDAWPPSPDIVPLFVSFHLGSTHIDDAPYSGPNTGKPASEVLLRGANLEYLRRAGRIGCRDASTVRLLRSAGIDAYFSGCLTLTLNSKWRPRQRRAVIVDVNCSLEAAKRVVPAELHDSILVVTHTLADAARCSQEARFSRAQELVWLYGGSSLVITSRLHCALPCLALGTPVVFVNPRRDMARLEGYDGLLGPVDPEDVERGSYRIDLDGLRRRHAAIEPFRRRLGDACRKFLQP